jgi:hypothetical protein
VVILGGLGAAGLAAWLALALTRSPAPPAPSGVEFDVPRLPGPVVVASAQPTPLPAGSAEGSSLDAGDAAEQQARRIIADSRAAYAACDTYEDDGTYDMVFRGDAGFSQETEFRTVVAGPGAIRLAYRDLPTEFHDAKLTQLIASDSGVLVYNPWSDEPETVGSLSLAIGALRGVSHGLSGAVLPLLPIGVDTPDALSMHDARVVGTEEIDGTTCDVIEGERRYGPLALPARVRIWIAQDDSLIRRLSEDNVRSAEDSRKLAAVRPPMPDSIVEMSREAGVSEADIEGLRSRMEGPLSTFDTITFHPKCNEPVAPLSLRATDGSL